DAEMIARLRQRRALPPAIARGVVFLVARHRFASNPAAEREELVADCRGRDLAAHGRHRRFLRPSSGRRLRLRDGAERGDHQRNGKGERQRNDAATHAILQFCRAPASLEYRRPRARAQCRAARVTATPPAGVSRTTLTVRWICAWIGRCQCHPACRQMSVLGGKSGRAGDITAMTDTLLGGAAVAWPARGTRATGWKSWSSEGPAPPDDNRGGPAI